MRAILAAFKLAPKTQDPEYENRSKVLDDLNEAIEKYESAMEKVKSNVKAAAESLIKVRTAFELMSQGDEVSSGTRDLVTHFGKAVDRITGDYLSDFTQSVDSDVIPAVLDMTKLSDECELYESARNKAMREYDVYRQEVSKRETEYAKKNKDLSASRGYNTDVVKRDELKVKFEDADRKFKDCHEYILQHTSETVNHCMLTFLACSTKFSSRVTQEMEALFESVQEVGQYEPNQEDNGTPEESGADEDDDS